MFEFEIIVIGYTAIVATTTFAISKFVGRKKINKLNKDLSKLENALKTAEAEIKFLKKNGHGIFDN